MNFKYEVLFTVSFRHNYFKGNKFSGFKVTPAGETSQVMLNHGLIFKTFGDHFVILYDTFEGASKRDRDSVLADGIPLAFRLDILDHALYNYTEGLPQAIGDTVCFFSNRAANRNSKVLLHHGDFVSAEDFVDITVIEDKYFSRPFGHVEIRVTEEGLEKNMEIQFAARNVFWQYILVTDHLKNLNAPAIINKNDGSIFKGPEIVQLPESTTGIAFQSAAPIALSSVPNRSFQLAEHYENGSERYKVIIDTLPNPHINNISRNFYSENFNGENNVITIIL